MVTTGGENLAGKKSVPTVYLAATRDRDAVEVVEEASSLTDKPRRLMQEERSGSQWRERASHGPLPISRKAQRAQQPRSGWLGLGRGVSHGGFKARGSSAVGVGGSSIKRRQGRCASGFGPTGNREHRKVAVHGQSVRGREDESYQPKLDQHACTCLPEAIRKEERDRATRVTLRSTPAPDPGTGACVQ
jgi:hypothetical protein